MTALKIFRHDCFAAHRVPQGHPERSERIETINALLDAAFSDCAQIAPPRAEYDTLCLVHDAAYVDAIFASAPDEGLAHLDGDTVMCADSLGAALTAAGGAVESTRLVLEGEAERVFVAARPPGHHAEPDKAMGFCFFSNAAIAAKYAISAHGLNRVAVVDFDVHHGNGTQAAFWDDPRTIFASSHQMPLFPGTGAKHETGVGNIFNAPIDAGADGAVLVEVWRDYLLPAVAEMRPELIIISAGFDAHKRDPLAGLELEAEDFATITTLIRGLADECAGGRIVSLLEGGYDLEALRDSAAAHLNALR